MTDIGTIDALCDDKFDETIETIVVAQRSSGLIPWSADDHADPWNHVEAAMALTAGNRVELAEHAYEWLASNQHVDGSWCMSYWPDGTVKDSGIDTNGVAYVAVGIFHHYCETNDDQFARRHLPMVERAIEFVIRHQLVSGAVRWSIGSNGAHCDDALLAGSSSIFHSLLAATELARVTGNERSDWRVHARRLASAIASDGDAFLAKDEYAMDWYYPVLAGVVRGEEACHRLNDRRERFVVDGRGVLCRSDRRWVTTAETAEFAMALVRIGEQEEASAVCRLLSAARDDAGGYATGFVYPQKVEFPSGERTTYSAAAVTLAADLLRGGAGSSAVFSLELVDDQCDIRGSRYREPLVRFVDKQAM